MEALIPPTLEDAINTVVDQLDAASIEHVKNPTTRPGSTHFFGGMALRNMWVHPAGSPLAAHFKTRFGLGCADDVSAIVLKGVWAKVRGTPFDPDAEATYYHDFWRKQGRSPIDGALLDVPIPPRDRYKASWFDRLVLAFRRPQPVRG